MRDIKGNDTNKHFSEENSKREQVFCDPVHGQISFDSLCLKIIDTQEFQRLRFLKQLGFVYTVYPGATNNRFEHSLGVAYLSKQFLLELRNNQPDLDITDAEIRCVQIAGLCHDLGHGPFSHFWEIFMEKSKEKRKNETQKWKHEDASIKIFNYIVKKYNLADEFKKFGIDQHGIQFITDLIEGRTRDNKRAFLYQIVNNEDSGLDVDKWDYYLRDCHYLGIKCGFEYKRLMQFARVIEVNGKNIICFRDKVISSICGMFRTRSELHHAAYQHRMAKRIDLVFCDALIKADIDGIVHAPNGENFKFYDWTKALTESAEITEEVMTKYCMLNDDIVYFALKYSNDTQIGKAIKMIETRFQDSKLYRTVARWKITDETEKDEVKRKLIQYIKRYPEKTREMGEPNQTGSNITCNGNFIIQNEVKEQLNGHLRESHSNEENMLQRQNISTEDFIIQSVSIDWGKGSKNPVDSVYFYSKDNMDEALLLEKKEVEWMIPKIFRDIQLSILCNQEDANTYENLKSMCKNLDISSL